jgi:hypothetical protein
MFLLQRVAAALAAVVLAVLASGCSAPAALLMYAAERGASTEKDPTCLTPGCAATAVLQHAYAKATEGDPTPCRRLNSVARALNPRCGAPVPGSLLAQDVAASGLPLCPLGLATREPRLWPLLPELLAKGALPEACEQPPLAMLAQAQACPDFTAASPAAVQALRWLAEADTRAVQHDVLRLLSCPAAQAAGLSSALDDWLAQGLLPLHGLAFSPLGALHPAALGSPLAQALEARGHRASAALGAYVGALPAGFDLALQNADRPALGWWFARVPSLANRVPATRAGQLAWLPLARVITPGYLADASQQRPLAAFLIAHGADPWRRLPHEPGQSVVAYARRLDSAALPVLDAPLPWPLTPAEQAAALRPGYLPTGSTVPR